MIPNSTEEDEWDMEKCGVLYFSGRRPTALLSHYLGICWVSCITAPGLILSVEFLSEPFREPLKVLIAWW